MRIVFFNHKGGVSKTTTAFHLGWKLSQNGRRVLLVDADPQCNLTSLIMQDHFVKHYSDPSTRNQNLMDGVNPAFTGSPSPIKAVNCFNVARNTNLFLLPGHPNLTELEPNLSLAQTAPNAFSTMQNLPGAFSELLTRTSELHQIDDIIIDLNPGLSAINQNLFSISDMFIIPTNPDPFSIMAIETLSKVLPRWKNQAESMYKSYGNSSYPFPEVQTRFGGLVIQRYNIRNGKPAAPFATNISEINDTVNKILVPNLRDSKMLFNSAAYSAAGIAESYCLAEIPDFQSLQPQSQLHGIPVFDLTDGELGKVGTVLKQMQEKRNQFDGLFNDLANKVMLIEQNA